MRIIAIALLLALVGSGYAIADNGILKKKSIHSVEMTAKRFEEAAQNKGMKIFPRFDHAEAASEYEKEMKPTIVVSVGNPAYGTPLMNKNQIAGIDFPPKAIVYEDAEGQVWIAYNSADYLYKTIFERHGLDYKSSEIEFYQKVLEELTDYAVSNNSAG